MAGSEQRALTGALVHDGQDVQAASILQPVSYEVHAPSLIGRTGAGVRRAAPFARLQSQGRAGTHACS